MKRRIECIVTGRVQMVMFRDFVTRKARKLGLVGYVENLNDGTVHAVVEGKQSALNHLVEYLHAGSILSRVDNVSVNESDATGEFAKFRIKY